MTTVAELREQVRGPVLEPGEDGYDELRRVHNGVHDRRPALIVRATSTADAVAAFGRRDATCSMVIVSACEDPAQDGAATQWVRDHYDAVHPYSGTDGGYVGFQDADDLARAPENYGATYDRLRRVKAAYAPDNFFHLDQNIEPAS
jgi:berberine-like enzyme